VIFNQRACSPRNVRLDNNRVTIIVAGYRTTAGAVTRIAIHSLRFSDARMRRPRLTPRNEYDRSSWEAASRGSRINIYCAHDCGAAAVRMANGGGQNPRCRAGRPVGDVSNFTAPFGLNTASIHERTGRTDDSRLVSPINVRSYESARSRRRRYVGRACRLRMAKSETARRSGWPCGSQSRVASRRPPAAEMEERRKA
jgi:hypothetical protein